MSTLKSVTIVHPSSAVDNIVNDASGNVAVGNNLTVAGSSTITGNETVTGTLTVGGAAVVAVAPTATGNVVFSTNGTTWSSTAKIVQGTAVASTSGTSIDFTSIPSWVKRVTVMFNGVSTNGSSPLLLRLGTSGGIVSSGYTACAFYNGGAGYYNLDTSAFPLTTTNFTSASYTYQGTSIFTLIGSNIWTETGSLFITGADAFTLLSGSKTLSGALTQVRVTTTNGTDTFDAGTINIMYE